MFLILKKIKFLLPNNTLYNCTKFGWNWPSCSSNFVIVFCHCILAVPLSSPLGYGSGPSFDQTWIPSTQALCHVWWNLVLTNIFQSCQSNFTILQSSPTWMAPYLTKIASPLPKDDLCMVWLKIGQWSWWLFCITFLLFHFYLPFEKSLALDLNKLDSLPSRMLCAKFVWNSSCSSGDEDCKKLWTHVLHVFGYHIICPFI